MEGFNRLGPYSTIETYRYQSQLWNAFSALGNNPPSSNLSAPFRATIPEQPGSSAVEPPKEIELIKQDSSVINISSSVENNVEVGNADPIPDDGFIPAAEEIVCEYCDAKFEFRNAWSEHLRAYHDVKKAYICRELGCDKAYIKRKSLDCHLRDFHHRKINIVRRKFKKINGKWKCDLCQKSFNSLDHCSTHRFTHFPARFSCILCDKKFYINRELQKHLKRHNTQTRRRKFDCKCGKSFINWRDYEGHGCKPDESLVPPISSMPGYRRKGSKTSSTEFKRTNFERSYNSNPSYKRTDFGKRYDDAPRDYLCENCGNCFRSARYLKMHIQRVHNSNKCSICSEKFGKPQLLLYHLKETHNEDPPEGLVNRIAKTKQSTSMTIKYLCEICSRSFYLVNSFGRHMASHYEEELQRQCKVCRNQFLTKEELKIHLCEDHKDVDMTKFPDLKVPQCQTCGKRFRSEELLESHANSSHQNKKQCPYCDKVFTGHKGNYQTHMRCHTGLKPYRCNHCKKTFSLKCNLNSHVQAVHFKQAKNYCRQCQVIFVTEEKYQEHLTEKHIGKYKFMCKLCYWGFDDQERYNVHRRCSHRQDISDEFKPHVCEFCSKRYTVRHSLLKHYKMCEANVDKVIPPAPSIRKKTCSFEVPENIKKIATQEEFVCKKCFFVFATREECYSHLEFVHQITNGNVLRSFVMVGINKKDEENPYNQLDPFMEKESNSIFKKYPYFCKLCHVFYLSNRGHDRHIQRFHPKSQESHPDSRQSRNSAKISKRPFRKNSRAKDSTEEEDSFEIEISNCGENFNSLDGDEKSVPVVEVLNEEESKNIEGDEVLKAKHSDKTFRTEKEFNDDNQSIISLLTDVALDDLSFSEEEKSFDFFVEQNSTKRNETRRSARLKPKGPEPNFFLCKLCNKLLRSEEKLEKHYEKHHPKERESDSPRDWEDEFISPKSPKPKKNFNNFSCKYCFHHFKKSSYLKQHIEKHHSTKNPAKRTVKNLQPQIYNLFVCKICMMPYRSKRAILSHFENEHKDIKIPDGLVETYEEKFKEFYYAGDLNNILKEIDAFYQANDVSNADKAKAKRVIPEKAKAVEVPLDSKKDLTLAEASVLKSNTCTVILENETLPEVDKLTSRNVRVGNLSTENRQNQMNECFGEVNDYPTCLTDPIDPTIVEKIRKEVSAVKKYMCKVCNIGWAFLHYLEIHIKKWHPDYYNIYPKEKVVGAESIVKEVMEDVTRLLNAKSKLEPKSTRTPEKLKVPRKKKPDSDSDEPNSIDKEYDTSPDEAEDIMKVYSTDSNSGQIATDLSTKPQDDGSCQFFQPTAVLSVSVTTQPNTSVVQSQQKNKSVPLLANREDILQNVSHSTSIANDRQAAMNNNSSIPSVGPTHLYNNQLYQNCLSSFDQFLGINPNPVFPTPSFGERPEPQVNTFPDWDSIFTSPVKNKNNPVTTSNLTNTYNQSGHLQNDRNNLPIHERPSNASHFPNAHPIQPYPGMTFQNQSLNPDPCLITSQTGLHQPYLNLNAPSTSHQQNYSNNILQNQLIPLASVANYQGPLGNASNILTLIGEKSAPIQKPIQAPNFANDSEEEPGNINDAGFEINYDSGNSCDDPKKRESIGEKKVQNDPQSQTVQSRSKKSEINTNIKIGKRVCQFSRNKMTKGVQSVLEESKTRDTSESQDSDSTDDDNGIPSLTPEELLEARKKVHICKICPMYYEKMRFLITHYKRDHPQCLDLIDELKNKLVEIEKSTDKITNCHICQKKCKDRMALYYHIRHCHRENKFKCKLCDSAFTRMQSLRRHLETHNNEFLYQCEICEQKFKTISSFEHHSRFKHKESKPFSCPNCKKPFNTEKGLTNHQENFCYASKKCPKCDLTFNSRRSLIGHYYEHEDNRIKCPKCARKFTTERFLKQHLGLTEENGGVCKTENSYSKNRNRKRKDFLNEDVKDEDESDRSSECDWDYDKTAEDSLKDVKKRKIPIKTYSRPSRACKPKNFKEVDVDI